MWFVIILNVFIVYFLYAQVKNDYQNLRKEILEVQELQKQVSDRLKQQVQQVHGHFSNLKERIAAVPHN